jgi:hypothetical protein
VPRVSPAAAVGTILYISTHLAWETRNKKIVSQPDTTDDRVRVMVNIFSAVVLGYLEIDDWTLAVIVSDGESCRHPCLIATNNRSLPPAAVKLRVTPTQLPPFMADFI